MSKAIKLNIEIWLTISSITVCVPRWYDATSVRAQWKSQNIGEGVDYVTNEYHALL
jgi:hypothetical protein